MVCIKLPPLLTGKKRILLNERILLASISEKMPYITINIRKTIFIYSRILNCWKKFDKSIISFFDVLQSKHLKY